MERMKLNDRYERLKYAIVEQAIKDYKRALRKKNGGHIAYFERWFLSSWGEALSGGHGAYIIEQCRKCVGMKQKPRKDTRYGRK